MASSEIKEGETLEMICRSIYISCDPECTDRVPTLKLIEFVKPYLEKHPVALKSLQADMDPEDTNVGITYQLFLEKMSMWVEKILDSHENNETFNKSPRNFEEHLVFPQSTPRHKLSPKYFNVTDSAGSSEEDLGDKKESNRHLESLSDEIKIIERVTYQKNKALSENELLKNQIVTAEEHIEKLQADLETYRMRLMNEQNLNELLKKDRMDDIKDEMNKNEQMIETYRKKVQDYERDNLYINGMNQKLESENMKLLQNCETLETETMAMRKELEEVKALIESKDMELSDVVKQKNELEEELKLKIFLNKDLEDENDFLDYQKVSLERQLSLNIRPMSPIVNVSQRDDNSIPVYSVNNQLQKFTHLWHTFPVNMINKNGGDKLNSSLPTKLNESVDSPYNCYRFPIQSGRDLHQSFMLSTSLADQTVKLNGYPEVSLQAELIQAQGSISEDCHENTLLEALRDKLSKAKKERQDLEEEYDAYKKEVASNSRSNVDIVGELEKLKHLCNSYKETIDNTSMSNEQLMKTVKLKTKKIVLLENKMKKRQHIINTTRSNLQKRMMLIKELNEQNKQLSEEYKEKLQSHDKLLRELDMKNQQIAQLSHELLVTSQQSNTNISSKESQINEALKNIARQQKLIEDLNAQIKQLTERQKSLEIANHNYEIIITDQTEQLVVKMEELNVIKKNRDVFISVLSHIHLEKKLAETTQELEITKQSTADQSMALARAKEEFKTLEQNYEETIATQRLLSETTGELAEAKRNFDALEQNYEIFNKKKCCDLQEDNHYSWITHAMKIIIFALIILSYLLYRGYDFGFNVIREINLGNSPK